MEILTNSKNILSKLEKINIKTSEELLEYYPYRYEDMTYSDENALQDKQKVKILGKLVSNPKHFSNGKFDIITFFFVTKANGFYNIKIFNRGYMMKSLSLGEDYSIIGVFNLQKKEIIVNSIFKGKLDEERKLKGVYHLPNGLSQNIYYSLLERTFLKFQARIIDEIPEVFVKKYRLLDKTTALKYIHFPQNDNQISQGFRTMKYHECLSYCLRNQITRGENKRKPREPKGLIDTKKINEFILNLGFKLTSDQVQAIKEIILDMNQQSLMYRLLQGDVGTGKTIVAIMALYGNYLRHKIGAFMVPTDSLARQQYASLKKLFERYGIRVCLIIGGLTAKDKNVVKTKLKNGEYDVVVGTHALFSEDVKYPSLGLAVIDEQHRFGVKQRNELISKSDACDLLLMSATPIPRTLALSIYGDLDISTLSQFPNQQRKVETMIVSPKSATIISTIKDCLLDQRQVFIVAPKIEDDNFNSAEKIYSVYDTLFHDQVRLLHGKMKSEEKSQILDDFVNKKFLILVSTTVIELGINVLSAGAIIIYSASSFGLASLHQLRGRVGRDGSDSVCLLVDEDIDNPRLKILKDNNDGFLIAEKDMELRGPGDAGGISQSGFPTFSCLNIVSDFRMFECARDDASHIITHLYNPEFKKYYDYVANKQIKEDITLFD